MSACFVRPSLGALFALWITACGSGDKDTVVIGGGHGGTPNINLGQGGGSNVHVDPGNGGGSAGTSPTDCNPRVIGLLRDFKADHPDFEYQIVAEKGIVADTLGSDKKPVFAGVGLRSVHTAAEFDQWYRDVPDLNMTYEYEITFNTTASGSAVYDNSAFFPLDGRGFGNESNAHNFHFTFELHMEFRYNGGEVFTFRGDDDVFVFVNNKLAIDLGGVHEVQTGQLDLDRSAAALGIAPGSTYPIDFFQAERHTTKSNFRIETTLQFTNCTPIIVR